jgi:hypothetical protein
VPTVAGRVGAGVVVLSKQLISIGSFYRLSQSAVVIRLMVNDVSYTSAYSSRADIQVRLTDN